MRQTGVFIVSRLLLLNNLWDFGRIDLYLDMQPMNVVQQVLIQINTRCRRLSMLLQITVLHCLLLINYYI